MKAIVAHAGGKVTLESDHTRSPLKAEEVLVKMHASPINPSDSLNARGGFSDTKFPIVLGRDYAGRVIEPVTSAWYGKNVYGTSGKDLSIISDGTHAEYVAVSEDALAEAPQNLDLAQAALLGTPWSTAWLNLSRAGAKKGETVLVIGASGSVGSAVAQLAESNLWGCHVFTGGRGSAYDVDTTADPSLSKVRALTSGRGVDIVVDTVGSLQITLACLNILATGGRLSIMTTNSSGGSIATDVSVNFKDLYRSERSIIGCNSLAHTAQEMGEIMRKIAKGIESDELQAPAMDRWEQVTLEEAIEAYEKLRSGSRKKFLIVMD